MYKARLYGEEFGAVRTDAAFCWVLDPIDGTKAFITGKPLFGTLIALCHHGRPIVGVIDQCVLKERWVGVEGKGTTLNGAPVTSTGVGALADAIPRRARNPGGAGTCPAASASTPAR